MYALSNGQCENFHGPVLVTGLASLSETKPPNNEDKRPPMATIPAFPPVCHVWESK